MSFRILHAVLDLLDLGAQVINGLLGVVELAKVLANLAQAGDVSQCLLLVNQLHGAGVDLALEAGNLAIDICDALVRNLGLGSLLLSDAAADLLVETLDLVELGGAGVLSTGLLLANLVGLGDQFLSALLRRVRFILILVGHSQFNLGLDSVLMPTCSVSNGLLYLPYKGAIGGLHMYKDELTV